MSREGVSKSKEAPIAQLAAKPAVETLLEGDPHSPWPESILNSEEVREAAQRRKNTLQAVESIFSAIPRADVDLKAEVLEGRLPEESLAHAYESLRTLLEEEPELKRLALYMPLELLPTFAQQPASRTLEDAARGYAETYMQAWRELLNVRDVRANFVDGDVPELGLRRGQLPRVVKAAHLIPALLERKLLSVEEALSILETAEDDTLKESVADALLVANDKRLLPRHDLGRMYGSKDPFTANLASILMQARDKEEVEKRTEVALFSLVGFREALAQEALFATPEDESLSEARRAWLTEEHTRQTAHRYGARLSAGLSAGEVTAEELSPLLVDGQQQIQLAVLYGLRSYVEGGAKVSREQGIRNFEQVRSLLSMLEQPERNEVLNAYHRFRHLGVVSEQELERLGTTPPQLAGPFSKNMERMGPSVREVSSLAESMKEKPDLLKSVYPVALFFGSRLKGYGHESADIDIAVFVRPETEFATREEVRAQLAEHFSHSQIQGKVIEFWLRSDGEELSIERSDESDTHLGAPGWSHVLFGAAWTGDKDGIRELHERLLVPYLRKEEGRSELLEELERDALQYRLMHKGYARFYPEQGGVHTENADAIDGDSVFWDSGYRRTALKLYLRQVFLPQLKEKSAE